MSENILNTSIKFLKGVGEAKSELIGNELSLFSYRDLLNYFPFRYVDRTKINKISDLTISDTYIQIRGVFVFFDEIEKYNKQRLEAIFKDSSGRIKLIWFKNFSWVRNKFGVENIYYVFGKLSSFNNEFYIVHPEVLSAEEYNQLPFLGKFQPMYNTTEKLKTSRIDTKNISQYILEALRKTDGLFEETLPETLLSSLNLPGINEAYFNVHIPENENILDRSLKRFRFEEALLLQLRAKINAIRRKKTHSRIVFEKVGDYFNQFYYKSLNFELTEAQKRVTKEIREDLRSGFRMNRLLQGDVGSGKTVVAMMAALLAIDNGFQSCLMSPTEILAQQHFYTIHKWISDLGLVVELLTSSVKGKKRKEILKKLEDGEIHILVGTHAVIEDNVSFKNIGLAIIDEQHRFGVMQRAKINNKNTDAIHNLVMTATPIPRTLALTIYGELDVSVIDELPKGRKEIITKFFFNNQRIHALNLIKGEIDKGRQIYIVYPLIKESEKLDLLALEQGYEAITRDFPMPKYETGIIHGRMTQDEKDFAMKRFANGLTDILVSTTVIEVGVDVPNASVMMIENAERFGLSQLHQLRGRVGRGEFQSYCVLVGGDKLSDEAKVRLRAMLETTDGFRIAEVDLKLRGPGDMLGTKQSGEIEFENIDVVRDEAVITHAAIVAQAIANEDPTLSKLENKCLKKALLEKYKNNFSFLEIA